MIDLAKKKRVVIKIGSAILVENHLQERRARKLWLASLASDIALLQVTGVEIVIVSSGAIALGRGKLSTKNEKLLLKEKQAAAAVGQIELMSLYRHYFSKYNLNVAQILLTNNESANRHQYLNATNTFSTLLENKIIPICNENDSVTTEEIKIGDNDRLAARVAQMIGADSLILFSDVDGLYDQNPQLNKNAKFIPLVEKISGDIEKMASGAVSGVGTGGMAVKIAAAKMALNCGCDTIIANGLKKNPLQKLQRGGRYTLFKAGNNKISSRKQWIADSLNFKGEIIINERAFLALTQGSSLLPVGVVALTGNFKIGDAVMIKDETGKHIASGLASYDFTVAKKIIGKKTAEIKTVLNKDAPTELVHRDNMVILRQI